jgi:hypothetical protein
MFALLRRDRQRVAGPLIQPEIIAEPFKEALIKCRKSACLEKLPSDVGDIQGAHFRN